LHSVPQSGVDGVCDLELLCDDGERRLYRGRLAADDGGHPSIFLALSADPALQPQVDRLAHEFSLRGELEATWAARPLELRREGGRTRLLIEDPGGEPLERVLDRPMEPGRFLPLAVGAAAALGKMHRRGLVHKDVKPANILVGCADGSVRLTGFGIASRLPRERQAPEPPELIAGALAYMAPEQTGRMNRSIDSRCDLYALGVTFYQMLIGRLPFSAADAMEWVHCHIARKPAPPAQRLPGVPLVLSDVVMKLLEKAAEDRYQTAAGLEHDLRRALDSWERRASVDPFPLGEGDHLDRLAIPEKLYGREREVEALLAAFDRVVANGGPELVLVSGYSGIGKSSVVNELQKALVPPRGLYAAGKFDPLKRDIPYSTLAQAFQGLTRSLLTKSDAELAPWREALMDALGPIGRLLTDLIPDLTLIVGPQPPAPELAPQEARQRFHFVFRRFVGVFARPEHPLALFLDDLQWLDAATLSLLEDLLTQTDVQRLLLVGAYRDNEVDAHHPLARKLAALRSAGAKINEIKLGPLEHKHVERLIADGLGCEATSAAPLAQHVHTKTAGNPFYVLQFIGSLADEGLLAFDHEVHGWRWDLERIRAKSQAGNVVELMVGKLDRLPGETQKALQELACLGASADVTTLAAVLGTSEDEVHAALWEAIRLELVERRQGAYRFVHDRIQEAAYSLIPETARPAAHLRIGWLLLAQSAPEHDAEAIFEIVNQLNRGAGLVASPKERERLAELNLIAGLRAKAATAYASAVTYLTAGVSLLPDDCWTRRRELAFRLHLNRAECEVLAGALADAKPRLEALSLRAADAAEDAAVAGLRIDVYTTLNRNDGAAAVGLDYLRRHFGIDWTPEPTDEDVRREYDLILSRLGDRSIEELIDAPLMSDPVYPATLDMLARLVGAVWHTNANLACMAICRAVNLGLENGICDSSCYHYVSLGYIAGPRFGDYAAGYRFGQLGCDLVEKRGLTRFQARTYKDFAAHVVPWTRHVKRSREILLSALEIAEQTGDLTFVGYSYASLDSNLLAAGDPLADVQRQAETGLAFARKLRFQFAADLLSAQLALVRTLRGLTRTFGVFDDSEFDEREIEHRFATTPNLVLAETCYWVRKLQARFFAGDYAAAVEASTRAQRLPWLSVAHFEETPEHHFFGALSRAACCASADDHERPRHLEALIAHYQQLQIYADNCAENFENRTALVGAEIARLEGREIDAERLYERSIRSACDNGFVHHEALAYELAGRFYAGRGYDDFARLYLMHARDGYLRWGADGKAQQLDEAYPLIRDAEPVRDSARTIAASVEQIDLATVIKVSQAITSEIVLDKLIDTLMRTAIEQAGAERGLLLLRRSAEQRIEAEATTACDAVTVQLRDEPPAEGMLPVSVLNYVLRTRESVILDDAAVQSAFAEDPYIRDRQARSMLCLPLINQGSLNGALYLENNLAPGVFSPARTPLLKLLASQAAIALENSHLYRDLTQREAKIRRLVDANIIGIGIWNSKGEILDANDAYLRMIGYDREDLLSGRLKWTDLTPPEWAGRTAQSIQELRMTGKAAPFEKEYFRKDGSRVPLLIGSAIFDEAEEQGFSFILDLTERKRAEATLGEMQKQLAHANRVATLGQLTASIAHEVNQPIAATVTNAQAALRWLRLDPPDLDEVRQALNRIVRDGDRAGAVVQRIRRLSKKASPQADRMDINAAAREVIELTANEAMKNGVTVRTDLSGGLPPIQGDRVQLQQVVLNLILNAIEAMSGMTESRELSVVTGLSGQGDVFVAVSDSGPGLTPAVQENLFKAFFTTKTSGLGLGLSICRSIIEGHGGRLWASANSPAGAVFQFTLPARSYAA
jgi:PAS domain S-box-containing protein